MDSSATRGAITLSVTGRTDQGRVRSNNEDAFLISDLSGPPLGDPGSTTHLDITQRGALVVVSDGMGGTAAGEVASALVVKLLGEGFAEPVSVTPERIQEIVMAVSRQVWEASKAPGRQGMGATMTALYFVRETVFIAQVGDSRAYLLRGGRLRQMTRDQSYVQMLLDTAMLTPEAAVDFPHRNFVLQAMGQPSDVSVAVGRLEMRRGDRLLLCSDGLSNKLSDDDMRAVLASNDPLHVMTQSFIDAANERGGEDNITAALCSLAGPGLAEPGPRERVTQTFQMVKDPAVGNFPRNPGLTPVSPVTVVDVAPAAAAVVVRPPPPTGVQITPAPLDASAAQRVVVKPPGRADSLEEWSWEWLVGPIGVSSTTHAIFSPDGSVAHAVGPSGLRTWDGGGWRPVAMPTAFLPERHIHLVLCQNQDLLLFGKTQTVIRRTAAGQVDVLALPFPDVHLAAASAHGEHVMFVGERMETPTPGRERPSVVALFDRGAFSRYSEVEGLGRLQMVTRLTSNRWLAANGRGDLVEIGAEQIHSRPATKHAPLYCMGALPNGESIAVGYEGKAYRIDPSGQLVPEATQLTRDLSALAIDATGEVWASGDNLVILRRSGGRWDRVNKGIVSVRCVALAVGPGWVRALASDGAILEGRHAPSA